MKQTIELLQNDVILANKTSGTKSSMHHNLFQTFRVSVRMFSLTVLHYDPIYSNASATAAAAAAASRSSSSTINNNNNRSNSNTRRFIVERIKPICDSYFDFVSTIDTSNVTTSSAHSHTQTIDKSIVAKYHQACALNDHFLVLLKPVTFNLVQKINQRQLNDGADLSSGYGGSPSSDSSSTNNSIHYSLNDMTLTVGYMQLNEYLLAENSLDKWEATLRSSSSSSSSSARKSKQQAQILEISQAASVVELVTFQDLSGTTNSGTTSGGIDQPCLKIQLTFYDPLDVITPPSHSTRTRSFARRGSAARNFVDLNRMLSRSFENVSLQLNHCLSFELDISLVDRLYYILNDVSKPTFGGTTTTTSQSTAPPPNRSVHQQQNKNKTTKVCLLIF